MIVYWSKLNKDLLMATRPRTLKIPRGLLTLPSYTICCSGLPKALPNHIACVGASLLGALGLPTMLLKYSNTLIVGSCKLSLPSFFLLVQVVVRQPLLFASEFPSSPSSHLLLPGLGLIVAYQEGFV